MLDTLTKNKFYRHSDYIESLNNRFKPGSDYSDAYKLRQEVYKPNKKYGWKNPPVDGPWMHKSVLSFLSNLSAGKTGDLGEDVISETDGFTAALSLIVVSPNISENVEALKTIRDAVATLSASKLSIDHALATAIILQTCITAINLKDPKKVIGEALFFLNKTIRSEINDVFKKIDMDHTSSCEIYGKTCELPGNFQSAVHALICKKSQVKNNKECLFKDCVRKVIMAGGCNCSRSIFVGSFMGSVVGPSNIPKKWILQAEDGLETLEKAIRLVENKNMNKLAFSAARSKL